MPHHKGKRSQTRILFSRPFRARGPLKSEYFLNPLKVGDFVDVVVNANIQKGMAHRTYHGKTGRVWNVTPKAVGVEIMKRVKHRCILKRIHVRMEHVRKSNCRREFLDRVKKNTEIAVYNKEHPEAKKPIIKREAAGPKDGFVLRMKNQKVETVDPVAYESVY